MTFEEILDQAVAMLERRGRLECRKSFHFNAEWNGKYYATKQVRPVFADEPSEIVVVTIYVYYF